MLIAVLRSAGAGTASGPKEDFPDAVPNISTCLLSRASHGIAAFAFPNLSLYKRRMRSRLRARIFGCLEAFEYRISFRQCQRTSLATRCFVDSHPPSGLGSETGGLREQLDGEPSFEPSWNLMSRNQHPPPSLVLWKLGPFSLSHCATCSHKQQQQRAVPL